MPAASRYSDLSRGHSSFPPTPINQASSDVFINGLGAARLGDSLVPHSAPNRGTHGRTISAGSGTVYVNGRPLARIGDDISCGDTIAEGSPNVFAGG